MFDFKIKMRKRNITREEIREVFFMHDRAKRIWNDGRLMDDEKYAHDLSSLVENAVYDESPEQLNPNQRWVLAQYQEEQEYQDFRKALEKAGINLKQIPLKRREMGLIRTYFDYVNHFIRGVLEKIGIDSKQKPSERKEKGLIGAHSEYVDSFNRIVEAHRAATKK